MTAKLIRGLVTPENDKKETDAIQMNFSNSFNHFFDARKINLLQFYFFDTSQRIKYTDATLEKNVSY